MRQRAVFILLAGLFLAFLSIQYASADLTQGLIGDWNFNNTASGIAMDISHLGINNLTLQDVPNNIPGIIDYALNFSNDTASRAYSVGNLSGLSNDQTLTISIWLNITNGSSQISDANASATWFNLWSGASEERAITL